MAYVSPSNRTTGDLITAAIWNQDVVANMKANPAEIVTTAEDIVVATGANALKRLAVGANGRALMARLGAVTWDQVAHGDLGGVSADQHHARQHGLGAAADHTAATLAALSALISDGTIELATQAEAEAGSENTKRMTALRTKQAIDALSPPSALTREGGNTTEATTTSSTAVDLLSATGLTIAALAPFRTIAVWRKASSASSSQAFLGWKLNTTTVAADLALSLNTTNAVNGYFEVVGGPRLTNYTQGGGMIGGRSEGGTGLISGGATTAAAPTAEITDVVLRAYVANDSPTVGFDEMHVYSQATS